MSEQANTNDRLFCSKPFTWFEVQTTEELGDVFVCCPSWLPRPIGNLLRQSVDEVWNGPVAQELRASILDGSFKYCVGAKCPYLQTHSGPVQLARAVTDPKLRSAIDGRLTHLPHGPREVNCSHDRSCNLACPTCRVSIIIERGLKREMMEIRSKIEADAMRDAEMLYITGSGDPFGSPYFRDWLQTMRPGQYPALRRIHLHTNAQMWTERVWTGIDPDVRSLIKSAEISIDAARPATYAVNRAPGRFDRLLENLSYIRELRRQGPLHFLAFNMVVQANNFLEMPQFVDLGMAYGADRVIFSQLSNWGTFTESEFASRAIHFTSHPDHKQLQMVLRHPSLKHRSVFLSNLTETASAAIQRTA